MYINFYNTLLCNKKFDIIYILIFTKFWHNIIIKNGLTETMRKKE